MIDDIKKWLANYGNILIAFSISFIALMVTAIFMNLRNKK